MKKQEKKSTPVIENRKARHQYQVLETLEVGVSLKGTEVKSIRNGRIQLGESWVEITKAFELNLIDCHIEEYEHGNQFNHESNRKRKLLAHRVEIIKFYKAKELKVQIIKEKEWYKLLNI